MQKISISGALSSIGFNYFKDGTLSSVATIDPLVVDVNSDGVDELLFAGFESQPNSPANYDNVSMSLFGWLDGSFTNLTTQWLPNGANDIEGSGELVSGDFNGDGLTDIFISGNADMDHYVNAYVLMNQGDHFIKKSLGSTWWQHGADVMDINNDGYDDVFATGYNQGYAFYFGSESGLLEYKITDDWLGYGSGVALGNFLNNGQVQAITVDAAQANSQDTLLLEIAVDDASRTVTLSRKAILPRPPLDPTNVSSASESSHDVRVVEFDFTGDGVDDAIVFSRGNWNGSEWPLISAVQFLENDGGGSFQDVTANYLFGYQTVSMPPYQPIIADYDFDGRRDIFISGPSFKGDHQSTSILFQNENGQFTDTGRSILSASVADIGSMAAAAMGPDNQWYFIHSYSEMAYRSVPEYQRSLYVHRLNIERAAQANAESLIGSDVENIMRGFAGADTLSGGAGNDLIYGNQDADRLVGGSGADTLFGGQQSDTVFGLSGADQVYGNKQDDTLHGGLGDDSLFGGQQDDLLYGQFGNDRIDGNRGNDTLYGEDGIDTFVISKGDDWVMDFNTAQDKIETADAYSAITQSVSSGNLVLTDSDGDTLTLLGVTSTLSEGYFV